MTDLLQIDPNPVEPEIREALSGNLVRFTGHQRIPEAVFVAAERIGTEGVPRRC